MKTRTGNFPIGFMRGGLRSEGPDLDAVIAWMQENGLEVIDGLAPAEVPTVQEAGLLIGTLDLPNPRALLSADAAQRSDAVAENAAYIRANASLGAMKYMVVMIPPDPDLPRAENFSHLIAGYSELVPALEESKARISIEGWPGPGALCCTPETLRALFREIPSPALGINFDPSHLVRMNVDPLRFLEEFGTRVVHIHGKDTELLYDNYYEFGTEQLPTFTQPVAYGAMHWRYTIPGHGVVRWIELLQRLETAGFAGCLSIELEDAHFTTSPKGRRLGILQGAKFLAGC